MGPVAVEGNLMKTMFITGMILMIFAGSIVVGNAGADEFHNSPTIAIPVSALNVEEAVATVSVLQDPEDSTHSFLGICESKVLKGIEVEGEDIQALLQKLCGVMKQLSREKSLPEQKLMANSYRIAVPLREPEQNVRAVTWTAKSLDDALAFVELLKSGKLKGLKALTRIPWDSDDSAQSCTECPISDLIFGIEGIKERGQFLK